MKKEIIIKQNRIISKVNSRDKENIEKAIEQVEEFFERKKDFSIIFLETREGLDKIAKKKTEDWVVGGNYIKNKIHMFNYMFFDKVSSHPKSNFYPVLTHEISHIFVKPRFPRWLSEGLACVVAKQDLINKKYNKKDLLNSYDYKEWNKRTPYLASGKFVRYLIENYGKNEVLELVYSLDKFEEKESFNKKFEDIIGKDFKKVLGEF